MPRNGFFFEQNFNCVLVDWTVFAPNVTCQMPCSNIGRKECAPNSMLISCLSTQRKAERSPGSQLTDSRDAEDTIFLPMFTLEVCRRINDSDSLLCCYRFEDNLLCIPNVYLKKFMIGRMSAFKM